jgi:hypothetical protein
MMAVELSLAIPSRRIIHSGGYKMRLEAIGGGILYSETQKAEFHPRIGGSHLQEMKENST